MNRYFIGNLVFIFSTSCAFAQSETELNGVKVYTREGWIVKSKNTTGVLHRYSFSYVTEGTDREGKVVSSTDETFGPATIEANEERHLFTAPQDRNRKITYKITNLQMLSSEAASSPAGSSSGRRRRQ